MPRLLSRLVRRRALFGGGILLAVAILAGGTRAQDNAQGPIAPPPTFEVHRIPSIPHPGPPPIPVEQIVAKFAANEDVAKKIYEDYRFQQTIRIEEDGGGKFTVTAEVYTRPDGQRYRRVSTPLVSTLKVTKYTLEDAQTMISFPLFFLTSDQIPNYNFVYAGQQQLDQLNAYVFQVRPKMLSRTHRLFQGVVFVDDQDLAIVETFGKFVNELPSDDSKLPFSLFEAYRENFQGKYWLPTYVRSDDYLKDPGEDELHLWLIVRSTNFEPNSAPGGPAPPAAPAASDAPAVKP